MIINMYGTKEDGIITAAKLIQKTLTAHGIINKLTNEKSYEDGNFKTNLEILQGKDVRVIINVIYDFWCPAMDEKVSKLQCEI